MGRRGFWWTVAVVVVLAASFLLSPFGLRLPGRFLVRAADPIRAEFAVVLAGDSQGLRIVKAAELVKAGYVPKVLVSGPSGLYGEYESEPEIRFAVRQGFPESWFIPFHNQANSTTEEAAAIAAKLREWRISRVDIVTSDYHTRRAGAEFRKFAHGIDFRMVAAPDHDFRADTWWKTRQSRKTFAIEWMKTVASWAGI